MFSPRKALIGLKLFNSLIEFILSFSEYIRYVPIEFRMVEFLGEIDIIFEHIFIDGYGQEISFILLFFCCQGRVNPLLVEP